MFVPIRVGSDGQEEGRSCHHGLGCPWLLFHVTASYPCLPQGALLGLGAGCSDVVPHQPLLAFLLVLLSLLLSFFLSALIRKLYAPQLGFVRDAKDVTEESQLG